MKNEASQRVPKKSSTHLRDGNPVRRPGAYFSDSIRNGKLKYFNQFVLMEYLDQKAEESYNHAMNLIIFFKLGGAL